MNTSTKLSASQKGFAPILIAILLAAALIGGAFVYTNYSNNRIKITQPQPTTQSKPKLSPTPSNVTHESTISGETANWKTYTNNKVKYSINYPPDWGLDKCPPSFIDISNDSTAYICSSEKFGGKIEPIIYYVYISEYNFEPASTIHLTQEIINNLTAYRTTDFPSRSGAETVLFRLDNAKYISVSFTPFNRKSPYPDQSRLYRVFDQILSTFKFLP